MILKLSSNIDDPNAHQNYSTDKLSYFTMEIELPYNIGDTKEERLRRLEELETAIESQNLIMLNAINRRRELKIYQKNDTFHFRSDQVAKDPVSCARFFKHIIEVPS
jgi:hypothetical protein